jgi:hypothetical protein
MAKRTKFQIRSDAARQRWHVRDDQKEGYWRQHIAAWDKSGQSKRAYCIENNLAYSSFMTWRREIELRDREKNPPANVAALLPNVEKGANPFVPVRILPKKVPGKIAIEAPPASAGEQQQIEIALPGGAVIRLRDGCDPSFVAKLLSCLKA